MTRTKLRRSTRTRYSVRPVLCFVTYNLRCLTLPQELIRSISDPEHRNMTLEQLAVVSAPQITFDERNPDRLTVEFTPTVPHCGMSTFIGPSFDATRYHRC